MKLLHKLKLDDLTGDQRELAETIGIDAYIKLVDAYGGSNIYIQKHLYSILTLFRAYFHC